MPTVNSGAIINGQSPAPKPGPNDPLTGSLPQWGTGEWNGPAGSVAAQRYNTWLDFYKMVGRNPSEIELAMLAPNYASGDPNWTDQGRGRQMIAQYAKTIQTPESQNKSLDEQIPKYTPSIQDTFNELLKRGATQDEIQHFGREMASGNLDAYTLHQFVQSMPEYQTNADKAFREGLSSELQGYDTKAFNLGKEDIISRYASAGRLGSSALDYALTDMLGKIADKRGEWLANLSASQYGGNKAAARSDYEQSINQMLSDEAYKRASRDALTQRSWNISDYNTQASDYERYLKSQKGQMPWGSLVGGAIGAGLGSFGGPAGASAGFNIGSGLGGGFDYYNAGRR